MTNNGDGASFWGHENILKLVVMFIYLCEYIKIVHFKGVNFMVCELYLKELEWVNFMFLHLLYDSSFKFFLQKFLSSYLILCHSSCLLLSIIISFQFLISILWCWRCLRFQLYIMENNTIVIHTVQLRQACLITIHTTVAILVLF